MQTANIQFTPQLFIKPGVEDISFYERAFGAVERRRWTNDDNSVHVAEFSIGDAIFYLHEEKPGAGHYAPRQVNGVTALVGLLVNDVDTVMHNAISAGAILVSPARDYEYGYRQGEIKDPFGHIWLCYTKS